MKQQSLKKHQVPQAFQAALHHHRQGRLHEAGDLYAEILRLEPKNTDALHLLGVVEAALGRNDRAMSLIERAVRLSPDFASYRNSLGVAYRKAGRLADARQQYEKALALAPDHADAHNNLANILRRQGRAGEAVRHAGRAAQLQPDNALFHNTLAGALSDSGAVASAISSYEKAISLQPDYLAPYLNVKNLYHMTGAHQKAQEMARKAIALDPHDLSLVSDYLHALNYLPQYNQSDVAREHRALGDRFRAASPLPAPARDHGGDRKLRIGYVSPDFRSHPVAYLMEGVLAHHDRDSFEIHCYYTMEIADACTVRLMRLVDFWHNCHGVNDTDLARQIRSDRIDILVDLAGHTAFNSLPVFAMKPAPVQASWLGYFNTTGVKGVDYLITDRHSTGAGEEGEYTEKLLFLPECRFCYTPPAAAVAASAPPSAATGAVTFGSFNHTMKINSDVIRSWSDLLLRVPDSRLVLKWNTLEKDEVRRRLLEEFAGRGIESGRIELRGFSPHPEMLAQYADIDVALDPFPFSGGVTTLEALWMGVPVVTLRGDRPSGRQSAAFLSVLGVEGLVAENAGEYVEIAQRLAQDGERLRELRSTLRERMAASPLCDGRGFTEELEKLYRQMWREKTAASG